MPQSGKLITPRINPLEDGPVSMFDRPWGSIGRRIGPRLTSAPELLIKDGWMPDELRELMKADPRSELGHAVFRIVRFIADMPGAKEAAMELVDRLASVVVCESRLYATIHRGALWLANNYGPAIEDYGLVGTKVVTTTGAGFVVDAWQGIVELEIMKYHGIGTGSGAEAVGNTALGTELTTEYSPNSTRATGTLTEGATANIFRTVATNTLDGPPGANIQEHGIFSDPAVGSGVLFDRTKFAGGGYALVSGDGLETPYEWTLSTGG